MGKAAREALWAKEKQERATGGPWWGAALVSRRATPGHWRVVKEHDDGRTVVFRDRVSEVDAVKLAGIARDRCPDAEVSEGWNYMPRKCPWLAPKKAAGPPLVVLEMSHAAVTAKTELERTARRLGMHPKGLAARRAFEKYRR